MSPRPSVEAQRREDVLNATWELITEVGYRRVRIADIAARTGTSTGIIHYYFETKEDVLDAAFRFAVDDAHRRSEEALAGVVDPWERLNALLDAHFPLGEAKKEWLIWLQLWNEAAVRPRLRALNEVYYGRWIDLVEGIVRDGQERGVFRSVDPRTFAVRLLTMMDGLVIQLTMGSSEVGIDRFKELLIGFAREQLEPRSSRR
jgi:AcrR family transcriptional regulator